MLLIDYYVNQVINQMLYVTLNQCWYVHPITYIKLIGIFHEHNASSLCVFLHLIQFCLSIVINPSPYPIGTFYHVSWPLTSPFYPYLEAIYCIIWVRIWNQPTVNTTNEEEGESGVAINFRVKMRNPKE